MRLRALALLAAIGLAMAAPAARAAPVSFGFTLDGASYSGSFTLSGDPLHVVPAGTAIDGSFVTGHEFIGYGPGAISDFAPITIGPVTFGAADILPAQLLPGTSAAVWFDRLPTPGTSPLMWIRFLVSQSLTEEFVLGLGVPICATGACAISPAAALVNVRTLERLDGRVDTTVVPVPAALALMVMAVAGFGLFGWRRRAGA